MKDKLLDEHQVLVETLLPTEWTWGCELEGYNKYALPSRDYDYEDDEDEDDDYDSDDIDYDYYYDETYSLLMRCLRDNCDSDLYDDSKSDVHSDGSLENHDSDLAFEWATPIFKATPKAFEGFIHTLYDLLERDEIYTDEDCGFHHHLMYNGMNERDCIWIYCNLAMDEDFIQETIDFDDFSLWSSRWASTSPFTKIRMNILRNNWEEVLSYLSTEKYRLFRIHPQGTLEWRGPRDFLNTGTLKVIKDFYYKHLQKIIMKFIEYNRSTTLFGTDISKNDFFEKLTEARKNSNIPQSSFGKNEFISNTEGIYRNKNKNPYLKREMNMNLVWKKLSEKPLRFSYLIKDNNPLLEIIFKDALINYNRTIQLKEILKKISESNGWLIDENEFTKRFINFAQNAGFTLSSLFANDIFNYLNISLLSKEQLLQSYENNRDNKILEILAQKLSLGEMEHLIYDTFNRYSLPDYIYRDYLKYIVNKFGTNSVLNFCYFLVKLLYQKNAVDNNTLRYCFDNIRAYVMKYGDNDYLTKWNNMALSITINKSIKFASLIIKLTNEEYVRLLAEFDNIRYYLPMDILNNLPENIKNLSDRM